jgi:virginiamycin B lyase
MPAENHGSKLDNAAFEKAFILLLVIAVSGFAKLQPSVEAGSTLPRYIDEYTVPTPNSAPLAVTVDRNGIVWFTESNASKLGRFDPATHSFKEYKVPGVGDMWGIAVDPRGDIWLTQYALKGSVSPGGAVQPGGNGRLIRFNPNSGNFTVVNVPTPGAFPFRIITDGDGRVWFTELLGNKIASYDPTTGQLVEYPVPTEFAGPADLTFDTHGMLWFTEAYNESVASFDLTTKNFVEYHFSTIDPTQYVGSPVGIAISPNGIVWIGDHGGNWVVEFNSTSLMITRYPTHFPPAQVYPISLVNDLVVDGQGRVWFVEHGGNSVGFLDPGSERMVEFAIPTGPISTALWLALAPDGNVWFTEWNSGKIGVLHTDLPVPFMVTASESNLSLQPGGQTSLALTLSGVQGINASGTYVSAWPSYNPDDVNVTFSPANGSLMLQATVSTDARITVSPNVSPGDYPLALGFDAGTVRVWTFVQSRVSAQTPIIIYIINNLWLLVVAVIAVAVAVSVFKRRGRASKQKVAAAR